MRTSWHASVEADELGGWQADEDMCCGGNACYAISKQPIARQRPRYPEQARAIAKLLHPHPESDSHGGEGRVPIYALVDEAADEFAMPRSSAGRTRWATPGADAPADVGEGDAYDISTYVMRGSLALSHGRRQGPR
ncbi:hypothetical protein FIBSPDRAFT_861369 [Athelia psychrophila]|uniref:Uncharacterized protein n=1 Tax=Athelia psychrophila TaxID=1759441 RepID=A0A166J973_9AGAM|nr:hypothetical protein FIBSPDRAFT_861369 [Fibularhizoctonia sp. CBS 109695]